LKVDCDGANGLHYSIILQDNTSRRCLTSGALITLAPWAGAVACEDRSEVCDAYGNVVQGYDERRRPAILQELVRAHGENASSFFISKYDEGTFLPYTAKEGGLPGQYLVRLKDPSCDLGSWTVGLDAGTFGTLGFTSFQGVGTTQLVSALQNKCANLIEQDVTVNISAMPWGRDWVDGAQDGRYVHHYGGLGVQVYVTDSGIDSGHGQLKGRVDPGIDFTSDVLKSTGDRIGHGTHCAGIIAGSSVGVAPLATVVPIKVLDDTGYGDKSMLLAALEYLLKQRRRQHPRRPMIVSSSLAMSARSTLTNEAYRKLVEENVAVVVAAGNGNSNAGHYSPASEPSVITVGAIDKHNQPASFSNYGLSVDIWAPGKDITSAQPGGGLVEDSGTSMAVSHVAGVAALILEANPSLSATGVRDELLACALNNPSGIKGSTGKILSTRAADTHAASGVQFCVLASSPGSSEEQLTVTVIILIVVGLLALLSVIGCILRRWLRAREVQVADVPKRSHEQLAGREWEAFKEAQPKIAMAIAKAQAMLKSRALFESGCDELFHNLRRGLRKADEEECLGSVPAKADVWEFLLEVGAKRWKLQLQVRATCQWLERHSAWLEALQAEPDLHRSRQKWPPLFTE
jgi:hypothetical protein